jgi:hypothetical protein
METCVNIVLSVNMYPAKHFPKSVELQLPHPPNVLLYRLCHCNPRLQNTNCSITLSHRAFSSLLDGALIHIIKDERPKAENNNNNNNNNVC